jgi:hypothetical protein
MILPRQARDKHKEKLSKERRFLQVDVAEEEAEEPAQAASGDWDSLDSPVPVRCHDEITAFLGSTFCRKQLIIFTKTGSGQAYLSGRTSKKKNGASGAGARVRCAGWLESAG